MRSKYRGWSGVSRWPVSVVYVACVCAFGSGTVAQDLAAPSLFSQAGSSAGFAPAPLTAFAPAATASPSLLPAATKTVAEPVQTETAIRGDKSRTRFVIGLERSADVQVAALSNPSRVIVDFPEMKYELPPFAGTEAVGLVSSFRGGLIGPGRMRVVIDVTAPVAIEKQAIEKGKDGKSPRLVLDLVPQDAKTAATKKVLAPQPAGLGAGAIEPPQPRPAMRPRSKATALYLPVIVIDPGHGGHDSGAKRNGTVEKDVVLAFSLKLREKLQSTGRYKVLMTRENDTFVELDDRRDFAETHRAALFIAVHADYAGSHARGATIYSLRDSTSKELLRSAKGEVTENVLTTKEIDAVKKADGNASAVSGILAELAQREVSATKERTNLFTRSVIENMGASTNMMSNPDREANYRVLKTAKVPSVLIELAYVSNSQDAQNLKSDAWRDKVSGSIFTAIENYFSHQVARLPM
jgi:N-acetylmuramoyl-L-alanine amidase